MTEPTREARLAAMHRTAQECAWNMEEVIDWLFTADEEMVAALEKVEALQTHAVQLEDELRHALEREAEAEYDCGLLRAEIEALEAEIELPPAEGYHTNPAGLLHLP